MEEILVSDYRSTRSGKVYMSHYDKNSIYLSIQIYKQLWIEDHYEFYMKVSITETHEISYPMRRFSVIFILSSGILRLRHAVKVYFSLKC